MSSATSLKVGGFVPLTFTDFPGELAAVVFCQGCPWECRYCHNPHLIPPSKNGAIEWQAIREILKKRVGLLDGVVFSGGEPTMQPTFLLAVQEVKELGFKVGLHTAGQYPERLLKVLPFLDWVGMDIKAPFGKYRQVTGREDRSEKQKQSIHLLLHSSVECEFRTTYHPALLSEEDLLVMKDDLVNLGVRDYTLQLFRKQGCKDSELKSLPARNISALERIQHELSRSFEHFSLRNL